MKKLFFVSLISCSFVLTAFTGVLLSTWNITDDYVIQFAGRGASGNFGNLTGTITFDPEDLSAASMNVSVAVSSIDTGNKTKNKHARGASWFDAEKYPTINITSNALKQTSSGFEFSGKLTMHGVTKDINFPFTFQPNNTGGIFEGAFTVNRQDFNIEGPFMAFTVSDEFDVQLKVPVQN